MTLKIGAIPVEFLAGVGALTFSPGHIDGLQLWLKADAGLWQDSVGGTAAVSDGDVVGAWADQSGNGNDASQATTSKKPLLKLNVVNGKPAVLGDGVDDWLSVSLGGARTQYVMFAVVDAPARIYEALFSSDHTLQVRRDADTTGYIVSSSFHYSNPVTQTQILRFYVDTVGSVAGIWRNGALLGQNTTGAVSMSSTRIFDGFTSPGNLNLSELIWYSTLLSSDQSAEVEAYLNARYALY